MSIEIKVLTDERIRDLYSFAFAWRAEDSEGDTDLSELRKINAKEWDVWLADHDRRARDAYEQNNEEVSAERARQIEKGYTLEHDRERGLDHLLYHAEHYAHEGETIKALALLEAAKDLLTDV